MKVLHVVASVDVGGAERHVLDLVALQKSKGIDAAVACPSGGTFYQALQAQGVTVFSWYAGGRFFPWTRRSLKAAIRRSEADVIHAHMAKSAYLVKKVAPTVAAVATAHTIVRSNAFSGYSAVICVSHAVRESLLKTGFPGNAAIVVHNVIDTDRFCLPKDREVLRRSLGFSDMDCVLVQVGRLEPVKGHVYALEALRQALNTTDRLHLMVVGEGTQRKKLERYVTEHDMEQYVSFLGFRDDVPNILQASDVCLMPSLKEGFGLAVVEAMACGAVPVAFRVGGIPESITHGVDGLMVEPEDVAGMCEAVCKLCCDVGMRRGMSTSAANKTRKASNSAFWCDQVLDVYSRIRRKSIGDYSLPS